MTSAAKTPKTKATSSGPKQTGAARASSKAGERYVIDCSKPVGDKIFDLASYEKFLHDRIKVEGRTGQLADKVKITKEGDAKLVIQTTIPFSKRSLKYLTKKYLKKNTMRDWLRVIATGKKEYSIVFFNLEMDDDNEEES